MDANAAAEFFAGTCMEAVELYFRRYNYWYIPEAFVQAFCLTKLYSDKPTQFSALVEASRNHILDVFKFDPAPHLTGNQRVDLILSANNEIKKEGHLRPLNQLLAVVEFKRDADPGLNAADMIRARAILRKAMSKDNSLTPKYPFCVHILFAIDDIPCGDLFDKAIELANNSVQETLVWKRCQLESIEPHTREHQIPDQENPITYQIYAATCQL